MTSKEIKQIVDDERTEQLTAQLCRHWEVATERLECLVQDLEADMDTCIEAEIYAAIMRMQSSMMALTELNRSPCAFLFTEYLDRITKIVSNTNIRQAVITLLEKLLGEKPAKQQDTFFEFITQSLALHFAQSPEQQEAMQQKVSPFQHILAACAQHLKSEDLMMLASVIQSIQAEGNTNNEEEVTNQTMDMRQAMEDLSAKMSESLQMMLMWLLLLMLLPQMIIGMMQQSKKNSQAMAQLFNKVLTRVRKSQEWDHYWEDHRKTLRVVNDNLSLNDIMTAERTKEREELGKVPGGLFAKWTTDTELFEAEFMDAHLSDDDLRYFIFHLCCLLEIARELDPMTKFGEEQLANNELQLVGEAVMAAARKLDNCVDDAWGPHYEPMWQELIQNEKIFAHLKVSRKSPHNNLFSARFFCHLVGEMKKSAVFGALSDGKLAEKLTTKKYKGTYRKNIQEGLSDELEETRQAYNTIYLKYKALAHPKQ